MSERGGRDEYVEGERVGGDEGTWEGSGLPVGRGGRRG